jgi:thioredoxin-like negative regulator of GroEL
MPAKPCPCKVRVLAFTASWCEPCRRNVPALAQIRASGVNVQIIDIDERPQLAKRYNVATVPMYIVYVCGGAVRTQNIVMVQRLTARR